ncbi:MAG: hypothetical protein JXQ29_05365 [Planctomycetes bacterium]|nr:hypothetical protein [Planctomycetota bacterium]
MRRNHLPLQARPGGTGRQLGDDAGTILLIVLFVSMAMSGLIFVGGIVLGAYKTQAETEFRAVGQARNVARAGLVDAFSWFRRQASQPVSVFAPIREETADPPILDTEDPDLGIVRHFQISGDIWARYEVKRADPRNPLLEIRDVSLVRGLPGAGQAWHLAAWGAVFRRVDSNRAFNESPNRVLGTARAFTEIRRLSLSPPGDAAINAARGDRVLLGTRTRVIGNAGAGVVYPLGTGSVAASGEISGSPALAPIADYDGSVEAVFGVPYAELHSLADDVFQNGAAFPSPIPEESLLIMEGDLTFDDTRPLRGTGVIFVNGNLTVDSSPHNFFNGLIYATGSIVVRAPSVLRGSLIAGGTIRVEGSGDYAEIEYDKQVLAGLMISMGQYRISKAIRFVE